jgi:hypothetical protein
VLNKMKTGVFWLVGSLFLTVLTRDFAAASEPSAGTSVHRHIEVGDSFLFTLEVKGQVANLKEGSHVQRYAGFQRNGAGGLIMELDGGPKQPEPYIHQMGYVLAADDCVVDLGTGTALLNGARCNQPLPGGGWTIRVQHKVTETCKVGRAETQKITVPAGTFATTEIRCSSEPASTGTYFDSVYWYSADIGAMVKGVRRKIDSGGKEIWSIADQLQSYEPAAHK